MTDSIITPKNDNMGIIPNTNNYGQIGSSDKKFYRMYATTFYGALSGNASTATALTTSAGSATQPVYFSDGKPIATTYTLGKSVPSNAVFTDTWRGIQNNLTSDSTTDSLSAAQGKVLKGLVDGKAASSHTHNYAGSASAGGSANSALGLSPFTISNIDELDSFLSGDAIMKYAKASNCNIGFVSNDGLVISLPWSSTYGAQIAIDDQSNWMGIRTKSNGTWNRWSKIALVSDIPTSLPASDVYDWAKASKKPSYTKTEVGLGNVDNTSDASKRVDHANTASQLGHDLTFSICDGNGNVVSKEVFNGNTSKKIVVAQGGHTHSQYLTSDYDTKNCTTTFTSGDSSTGSSTPPAVITSGETHKSLFNKLSTAVKNVRWLLSKMGTTDISSIGNGTVTGALSTLNSNKQNNIYVGLYRISKPINAKTSISYTVNLTDLNITQKSIFWGFAYQQYSDVIYEKVCITSTFDPKNVYIKVYNGHDSTFTIPILCVAFSTI